MWGIRFISINYWLLYYAKTYESVIIGIIGAMISIKSHDLILYNGLDDPVGAIGVHYFSVIWGIISSGLFVKNINTLNVDNGLFYGGGFYLLGIQILEVISISAWTLIVSAILFYLVDKTIGLRVSEIEEKEGADLVYHILPDNLIRRNKY